jgi:hypothetical protein
MQVRFMRKNRFFNREKLNLKTQVLIVVAIQSNLLWKMQLRNFNLI